MFRLKLRLFQDQILTEIALLVNETISCGIWWNHEGNRVCHTHHDFVIRNFILTSATKLRRLCFYTCLSVHRGGLPQCILGYHLLPQEQAPPTPGSRQPPGADTPLGADTPQEQAPPPADGYCCGQHASYWNAFLFHFNLSCFSTKTTSWKYFDRNCFHFVTTTRFYI